MYVLSFAFEISIPLRCPKFSKFALLIIVFSRDRHDFYIQKNATIHCPFGGLQRTGPAL